MYQKLVCVCTKLNQVPNDLCTSSTKIRLAARSMGNASDSWMGLALNLLPNRGTHWHYRLWLAYHTCNLIILNLERNWLVNHKSDLDCGPKYDHAATFYHTVVLYCTIIQYYSTYLTTVDRPPTVHNHKIPSASTCKIYRKIPLTKISHQTNSSSKFPNRV